MRDYVVTPRHRQAFALDVNKIMRILPHRYPFLLVDRVVAFEPMKSAVGIKNVTVNEPFFQGHWPDLPVMPGVLILEALAQVSAVLVFGENGEPNGRLAFFHRRGKSQVPAHGSTWRPAGARSGDAALPVERLQGTRRGQGG